MTLELTKLTLKQVEEMKDICFENPMNEERLTDDLFDLFDAASEWAEGVSGEVLQDISEYFSNIVIFKKELVNFNSDYVIDFLCDNFYIDGSDELEGLDELEKAIEAFNAKQTSYTSGKKLGVLDCSTEILKYLMDIAE